MTKVVHFEDLIRFSTRVFQKTGFTKQEATTISTTLVEADLRGVSSHGVMRIPWYIQLINDKEIKVNSDQKVLKESNNHILIDSDYGMGQIYGEMGMRKAMEKAKKHTIGVAGISRANHFGAASYYSKLAAKENMIGIVCTSTRPFMPPPGGAEKVVGNNPLSIAIPANRYESIVLDMATSVAAAGKIMIAAKTGESIPEGWALDKYGKDTTDPNRALESMTFLPVGGPKGFGLAVAIDVLSGVLLNSAFSVFRSEEYPRECGLFFIAIDIESFTPIEEFKENIDRLIETIKHSTPSEEGTELMYPGEPEQRLENKRRTNGIPLTDKVYNELNTVAVDFNLDILK